MSTRLHVCMVSLITMVNAASVDAYEIRCRWVERVGNTDIVIGGDGASLDVSDGALRRIRLQFGVFDDDHGAAPAGGFIGWNAGILEISDGINTRTPGRIAPYVFAAGPYANGNPPLPGGDPFTRLTGIDATLGPQSPYWSCTPDGIPPPPPEVVIRGLNTYVSVYEFTTNPASVTGSYSVTASGYLITASEWHTIGTPFPPDCGDPADPNDDVPGSINYTPLVLPSFAFTCVLALNAVDCQADFNDDGRVNSQDYFDYLVAFFASDPAADFDASGTVDSQDFFAFLEVFFVGC